MSTDAAITLERMDDAVHYNAWLAEKFNAHLGRRVLEVGAGTGTITARIAPGKERVVALEIEQSYVDKLKARFGGDAHVRPYLADVALADWPGLAEERLDSILLSNVLEHIPDDHGAVRRFRGLLPEGGALVIFVPAHTWLFGSLDEAVGHHRRYTPATLRTALEGNGFRVERLEWMNLVGIPGWFLNSRLLRRRTMPPLQLKLYDAVAPLLARAESLVRLPVGLSLFTVARAV
jgi:SAM-dependent methyltransferase